jgi:GNAT superfamily N-acetyltransferase
MTPNQHVRRACDNDAEAAIQVIRDSVTLLCEADHHNEPQILERWLSNKTSEHFRRWLSDPETFLAVADVDSVVRGVALLRQLGEIQLCYVQPGFQRQGLGRSLLMELERQARIWGLTRLRLNSSHEARHFYEHHGFQAAGPAALAFGYLRHYPYVKAVDLVLSVGR